MGNFCSNGTCLWGIFSTYVLSVTIFMWCRMHWLELMSLFACDLWCNWCHVVSREWVALMIDPMESNQGLNSSKNEIILIILIRFSHAQAAANCQRKRIQFLITSWFNEYYKKKRNHLSSYLSIFCEFVLNSCASCCTQ